MIRLSLFVALALLPPTLAQAEDRPTVYKTTQSHWVIMKGSKQCVAARGYEGDHFLHIGFDPVTNTVAVGVTDPNATSLKEGQEIKLHVFFFGANTVDDGWGLWDFTVGKDDDGRPMMLGAFDARDMLRDIARSESIAFSIDAEAKRPVGLFPLKGSAAAVAALRQCSFEAAGLNPNDPFLR